ncbi:MAG TPA: thiamine pyrophosphate-dependent enzyme [Bosea sp. (in: a-proteobacteria)]|jgi:2-oxoisovalerate dehydrogenase E1 component|uniref:alpha-ketoacid dehydrogenase subunit alpha/beta n=1 Tax=Bosea sp. (in: a-proteobacteria) TaxID=1871050 RepID=UPI002E12C9C1|nr:thiamine pyrophosphate-dependent enzyme [Bosea sp. (in: a-proteobacteria)]
MPRRETLQAQVSWTALRSTPADWKAADPALLGSMLTQLHLIRAFEESVLELAGEGLVHGPAHSSIGQEGGAVGSVIGLRASDQVNGSHRGHHQFLAKALSYLAPTLDPVADFDEPVEAMLHRSLAEILGLEPGFGHGRGGSMHLRWIEAGGLGTNAIVGGGVPLAAGAAMAHKLAGTGDLAVTYFGDGAINIGSTLETMNLAAAWALPLIFVVENNLYAVATHVDEASRETRLSGRGPGFGIPSWRVDGMDPLAVHLATQEAAALARAGKGPSLIELEVYRFFHQNGPLPGSAFGYRPKEEEAAWRARDPLARVATEMTALGLIDETAVTDLRERAVALMKDIAGRLLEPEGNRRRIRPELWPDTAFVDVGLRGELPALPSNGPPAGPTLERKFVDAIADVLHRRLETDPSLVIMGEDIHRLKGGTNGATRGLAAAFPDRVLGTPISENAFTGLAGGLAMDGRYRPIIEFMYPDFMWVAADQVFNQIGKARHMFGGTTNVPLVLRSKIAMGTGYGSQHSLDPAGVFATSPGWRIVAPSTAQDYIGLMNAALKGSDPVLVIEHVDLYQMNGMIPAGDLDYTIPLGKARIVREGRDLTILTYSAMVHRSVEAVEALGVDAEIVDLRTLDRASLDWETIGESVRKTHNVLIVEQGARGTSYGAMLADELHRRLFDWLDQPVQRVHGREASPTISKVLERAAFAGREEVVAGIARVMAERGTPLAGAAA